MRVQTLLLLTLSLLLSSAAHALTIDPPAGEIAPIADNRGLFTSSAIEMGIFSDQTSDEVFPEAPFSPFDAESWSHQEHAGIRGAAFARQSSDIENLRLRGNGVAGSWGGRGDLDSTGEFTGESNYEVVFGAGGPLSWDLSLELQADHHGGGESFASFELINLDSDEILAQFIVGAGESLSVQDSGVLSPNGIYALRATAFSSSRIGGDVFSAEGRSSYHFSFEVTPAIPEPGTALLLGASLAGLGWMRRRVDGASR